MQATITRRQAPALTLSTAIWYFMRVSGVAMLVLVLGHLLIMHYLNAPSQTNASFVDGRWSSLLWQSFDWMLLMAALLHGLAGAQSVAKDYLHGSALRPAASAIAAILAVAFVILGTITILTFDPNHSKAVDTAAASLAWVGDALTGLLTLLATVTYLGALAVVAYVVGRLIRGVPAGRWGLPGQWAWTAHRLTGLGIVGFLLVHVLDIMLLPISPTIYDKTIAGYANPYLIPMEVALVAAVLYHGLNGARLIAIEIWDNRARKIQGPIFYGVVVSTVVLVIPSIVVMLRAAH